MKAQFTSLAVVALALTGAGAADAKGPEAADYQELVNSAHARYKDLQEGENASYIPILTETPSDLFGVVIVTRDGKVYTAGDVDYEFSIQSVSKPFTAGLIMKEQGAEVVREKIGVEPTGMAFNSKLALAAYENSVNPLVNAGAIAAVSLVQAGSEEERWNKVLQNISDFAGRPLTVLEKVYESEYSTAFGNRGIANLLYNWGRPGSALIIAGLVVAQLVLMAQFLRAPREQALMLSAFGVPFYVSGMMVSAVAVRGLV
jgi:glutaminase